MADARRVAGAVPAGASVYVSGQLIPTTPGFASGTLLGAAPPQGPDTPPDGAAAGWTITSHRAGFPSVSARAGYLAKRWRGAVTGLLAFGHPTYGLVQRHSAELRAPAPPGLTEYLVLDALEDPRLYGVAPEDLALSAGTLRLYRQAGRPALLVPDLPWSGQLRLGVAGDRLAVLDGGPPPAGQPATAPGALPPAVLPIGESLPGRRQGLAPRPRHPPTPALHSEGSGRLVIGFHAVGVARVRVVVSGPERTGPGGAVSERDLVLTPGLTWYTTPEVPWPAEVSVSAPEPGDAGPGEGWAAARPVAALVLGPEGSEALERSPAGTDWPLLTFAAGVSPEDGGLSLEAWYTYLGPREGGAQARLHDSPELWLGGQSLPSSLHLGPGGRAWRVDLTPGQPPRQEASDGRQAPDAPAWNRGDGQRWLWLEVGPDRKAALHEPPLVEIELEGSGRGPERVRVAAAGPPAVVLPFLAEPELQAPLPEVPDGTLVKGSGDDLFYVDGGKLRWVQGPEVLERRRIPWSLRVLDDHDLWRLPVALPLT
jgi:hypothetical protein